MAPGVSKNKIVGFPIEEHQQADTVYKTEKFGTEIILAPCIKNPVLESRRSMVQIGESD